MLEDHPVFESLHLLLIIGAGPEAWSVVDLLASGLAEWNPVACVDPDPARHDLTVLEVPVVGGYEKLESLAMSGVTHAALALGGRSAAESQTVSRHLESAAVELVTLVHPAAVVASAAQLEPGVVVLAGAVVGAGAVIGTGTFVGAGAIIGELVRIGPYSYVGPGSRLAAGVQLPAGACIGLGACVARSPSAAERPD